MSNSGDSKETTGGVDTSASTPVDAPATTTSIFQYLEKFGVTGEEAKKLVEQMGITAVEDLAMVAEDDLTSVGIKPVPARKLLAAFKKAANQAPAAPEVHTAGAMPAAAMVGMEDALPAVPSDESWFAALRTGGVLKVETSTVIAAVRAGLAQKVGMFTVIDLIVKKMEEFSDTNSDPAPSEFYKLRKQLTRRNYADLFDAVDGLDGNYVTDARKRQLFEKLEKYLWPELSNFSRALKAWYESWMQGVANPAMMLGMMAASVGGSVLPTGIMQPPDSGPVRDAAEAVVDAINKCFSGTSVPIAAALAYEANTIKAALANERLPAMIGVANREQMLRSLGVAVPASYTRLETNLTRYVLSVMQAKDQSPGVEEMRFFGALYTLGQQIPWEQVSASTQLAGIGGRSR